MHSTSFEKSMFFLKHTISKKWVASYDLYELKVLLFYFIKWLFSSFCWTYLYTFTNVIKTLQTICILWYDLTVLWPTKNTLKSHTTPLQKCKLSNFAPTRYRNRVAWRALIYYINLWKMLPQTQNIIFFLLSNLLAFNFDTPWPKLTYNTSSESSKTYLQA